MSRKVLFVHDGPLHINAKDEVFGIQFTEEVKQRYLQLGDTVTFCTREKKITDAEQSKYSRILDKDFNFVSFPNFKSIGTYVSNKLKSKRIIENQVKKHDVVVVRMPSASGSMAIKAARAYNIPYLVEMVACTYDAYLFYNWKGKLIAPYKLKKVQDIIKDCSHVIYVTKNFLQKRYPTDGLSTNVSNVELQVVGDDILAERITKINEKNAPLVLASIGVIDVKYKGQADVIKALYKLKAQNLIYHYKIVGSGNPMRLQNLINKLGMAKEVEIVGSLPFRKINNFLKSVDIYIQPSKTEGLPRALIEAMGMGCPALGSKVGGIPELLNPPCLFEAGNVNEIAVMIKSFNKDKLIKEANANFVNAKQYQKDILEQRRSRFYKQFLEENKFI